MPLARATGDGDGGDSDGYASEASVASAASAFSAAGSTAGGRLSLAELLQRLQTAADLAFSAVATRAGLGGKAAGGSGEEDCAEARAIVRACRRELDAVVATERCTYS